MALSDQITALASAVAAQVKEKAAASRQIIAGTGLTGGGDLTVNRTLAVAYGTAASTATQGNDSRVQYEAPILPTLNSAKFASLSTSGAPGFQSLRVWRQGRTAFASGLIKNTVDIGFGGHAIVNAGVLPASLRPRAVPWPGGTVVGTCVASERPIRIDVASDGSIQVAVGLYTIATGQGWAINVMWPSD